MKTRYLEHFTQDEVDKAATETLAKDLPYGGNRPYVIGTILRDPINGEYVLWEKGSERHRLCIEHAPHELVEWTIATETMLSATMNLQQLTRSYPFAKVKRVGMIPLSASTEAVSSEYYDSADLTSRNDTTPMSGNPVCWFRLSRTQCEMKLTQTTPLTKPTYCEPDALFYEPYYTDKIYLTDLHFGYSQRGVLFYCVYELHDGMFYHPFSDLVLNGIAPYGYNPFFKINITKAHLKNVCINCFDNKDTDTYSAVAQLSKLWTSPSNGAWAGNVYWTQIKTVNNKTCYYNDQALDLACVYGEFLKVEVQSNATFINRVGEAWFRFTSDAFAS